MMMLILLMGFFTLVFPALLIQCVNSSPPSLSSSFANGATPAALYVLGDSLVDSGNNNFLPTLAKANFLPYGSDFPGGPTGRFTNGRTIADFFAEFMDLPYAPPYLSLQTLTDSATTPPSGLNYASSSCGILFDTGKRLGGCWSLGEQISKLEETINWDLPKNFPSKTGIENHLSKSLFLISIGANDYLVNYLQPFSATRAVYTSPHVYAQRLADALAVQFKRLYHMGARKVLVFEIGPIGCIPSMTKKNRDNECVEEDNLFANLYNYELRKKIQELTSIFPDFTLILGSVYQLAYDAIKNPSAYGLSDVRKACCQAWDNGTSACIPELRPCDDPSQRFFWDGFHLTEAVYKIIAERCFTDSSICSPLKRSADAKIVRVDP